MLLQTRAARQAFERILSLPFVAPALLTALLLLVLLAALALAALADPHLSHLAQSFAHQGLAIFRPMDPCAGGTPTC